MSTRAGLPGVETNGGAVGHAGGMQPSRRAGTLAAALALIALGLAACSGDSAEPDRVASASSTDDVTSAGATGSTTGSSAGPASTASTPTASSAPAGAGTPTTIIGSGVDETRPYPLAGFRSIDVDAFSLTVNRGDTFAVSVTADNNVFERLVVEVRDGTTLHLGVAPQTSLRQVTLRAEVTMPELDGLDAAASSGVNLAGFTTDVRRTVELSGGSRLDGDLRATSLELEASGASQATLRGGANELVIDLSGASKADATGFSVSEAEVDLSGASEADLTVTGTIRSAELGGASQLRYGGGGSEGDVETSGGSRITKR